MQFISTFGCHFVIATSFCSYQGKQGWAPASYLEKPAAAVLRQSSQNLVNPSYIFTTILNKSGSENRRSYSENFSNAVELQQPELSLVASPVSNEVKRPQLVDIKSNLV